MNKISKALSALALVAGVITLSGCMTAPVQPPRGIIYTSQTAPLFNPITAEESVGSKSGESSAASILGLIAWGDAGLRTATQEGGITQVKHVDYEYTNIIGIYQEYKTIVYGD